MTQTPARLVLLTSAFLAASAPLAAPAAATSNAPVYKQSASGSTIHPALDSKFKVRLKVCEDCGDHWEFAHKPDKDILKRVKHTDVSSATPPAVGGINTETWTYKAVRHGKTTIQLVRRSASHHQKVTKRFNLTVKVKR
jgi:predicted secreted protein